MNAQTKIETGRMTSKGQVLIPKALREIAGLAPNDVYKMRVNDAGEIVVSAISDGPEDADLRKLRMVSGLNKLRGTGTCDRSTDEIMCDVRGNWEP